MKSLLKHKILLWLILPFFVPVSHSANAQSGTIFWKDGTTSRVDSFSEVSVELVYAWWNRHKKHDDSEAYFRKFNVSDLKEISFIRQRGRYSTGFYYRVRISGYDDNGEWLEEEIPTWDWLDMTTPAKPGHVKTRVTFFHQKRRIPIRRIEFYEMSRDDSPVRSAHQE